MIYDKIYTTRDGILFINNGNVYCHGDNYFGLFGLGPDSPLYVDKSNPLKVPWNADEIITSGGSHIFFRKDKDWYACGNNTQGQLGLGDSGDKVDTPMKIPLNNINKIIANDYETFIRSGNTWYACGANYHGQLFVNSELDYVNTPMRTLIRPKKIVTDQWGSTILTEDDEIFTYGFGNYGHKKELIQITNNQHIKNYHKNTFKEDDELCQRCQFDVITCEDYNIQSELVMVISSEPDPKEYKEDTRIENKYCLDCLQQQNLLSERGKEYYDWLLEERKKV